MASKLEDLEAPSWTDFLAQYARAIGRAQRVPGQMAIEAVKGMAQTIEDAKRESLSAAFGGDYNPKPVLELGMLPMGGTAASAPRGALGAGPSGLSSRLNAARKAREAENAKFMEAAQRGPFGAGPAGETTLKRMMQRLDEALKADPPLAKQAEMAKFIENAPLRPPQATPSGTVVNAMRNDIGQLDPAIKRELLKIIQDLEGARTPALSSLPPDLRYAPSSGAAPLVSKGDITKALEEALAMPAVHTPKFSREFVPEIDTAGWTQVGPRGGVSPGGLYRTPTGEEYYLKSGPEGHVQTERIARELYGLTGAPVPQTYRAVRQGEPAIASRIIPGKTLADLYPSYTVPESVTKDLSKHMATDLWLKNTDLHGHNVLVPTVGKPARIDFGAALDYDPFGRRRQFSSSPSDVKWDKGDIMGSHIYGKRPDFAASAREALLRLPQEEVIKALSATEETKRLIGPALERRREILRQFLPDEKIDTILIGLAGGAGGAAATLDPEMRSILEALQAHQTKKEGK